MDIDSVSLSTLMQKRVDYADRTRLPYEEKYADSLFPFFTKEELKERDEAMWKMVYPRFPYMPGRLENISSPISWLYKSVGFKTTQRKEPEVFIFRSPDELSEKNYWELYSGLTLPSGYKKHKSLNGLLSLHHCFRNMRSDMIDAGNLPEESHNGDCAIADTTAIATYFRGFNPFNPPVEDIKDYVAARYTSSFLGHFYPVYYTGTHCRQMFEFELDRANNGTQADAKEVTLTSFPDAFYGIRELQIRAMDYLNDRDTSFMDGQSFREEHQEAYVTTEDGFSYQESIWVMAEIKNLLGQYSHKELFRALGEVVKEANISDEVRTEGAAILEAQCHFLPHEASLATRPAVTASSLAAKYGIGSDA